jgi:hypothetical protein
VLRTLARLIRSAARLAKGSPQRCVGCNRIKRWPIAVCRVCAGHLCRRCAGDMRLGKLSFPCCERCGLALITDQQLNGMWLRRYP